MCRNAKIPAKKKLQAILGGMELPKYTEDEVNSFGHPDIPIIKSTNPNKVEAASWGLIPEDVTSMQYAEQIAKSCRLARAETIFQKQSYAPYIMVKRCLVFLDGFYENQHLDAHGKKKQKYFVSMKDEQCFATGGIYTEWFHLELKQIVNTCAIITTDANPLMAKIHNSEKRQPLMFEQRDWLKWLSKELTKEDIVNMITIFPDTNMKAEKVIKPPKGKDGEQSSLF